MTKTTKPAATKISGTKTPAEQAKAIKNAKGPKAGSARSNQTAKLAANPDTIKEAGVVTASGKDYYRVAAGQGAENSELFSAHKFRGELAKLAVVGGSLRAVRAFIKANRGEAKLATGLDGRNAPQSAQAAAESKAKPEGKASQSPANTSVGKNTKTASGTKTAPVAKASAGAKLAQKGDDRAYVATDKEDTSRDGTFRRYMINTIRAHKTVGAAKAAHAKSGQYSKDKLNHNWAAQNGFIKFV